VRPFCGDMFHVGDDLFSGIRLTGSVRGAVDPLDVSGRGVPHTQPTGTPQPVGDSKCRFLLRLPAQIDRCLLDTLAVIHQRAFPL